MMTAYVALLRAVNVGGTGKLSMTMLTAMCEAAGFDKVRTYIASGNVVFASDGSETRVRSALEQQLLAHVGKDVGVIVRTAAEMASTLARNPFAGAPGNRVVALFVDGKLSPDPLDGVTGIEDEEVRPGERELFIHYPRGMAKTRIAIPAAKSGTARNMNTVAKLADMAAAIA